MYSALALALATTALAAPPVQFEGVDLIPFRKGGLAIPVATKPGAPSNRQTVLYWGQNSPTVLENSDLSTYCQKDSGVDIIILSFLSKYGKGTVIPGGSFDRSCGVEAGTGKPRGCDNLAKQIKSCQDAGVKVLLSLGGGRTSTSAYDLESKDEAEQIAQNLWEAYGPPGSSKIPRPFGDVAVDGFDLDVEGGDGTEYYADMINKLRSNFPKNGKYAIAGAPQCPIPDHNLQTAIEKSQFDYLFIQFYNNGGCAATDKPNYDEWKKNIANTPSKDAKLFIGVPASPNAANDNPKYSASFYVKPDDLLNLVNKYKDDASFGGVMAWSAGFSDSNVANKCNYMQQAKSILTTGKTC